jgi:ribose transport system ATP-binding protein
MTVASPAIAFENVTKTFPGVKALEDVSFTVNQGEVHALLGENGAGKSTLLNILHGVYAQYQGSVAIGGRKVAFQSPSQAIGAGVAKVHQEINLVPELTVAQNIAMGYEPRRHGLINFEKLNGDAREILAKLGCHFAPTVQVKTLSTGEMQMIGIAKALYHNASIISFDEPTTALTNNETEHLFRIISELKQKGFTIIYVSHKLDEIFRIADRATVLRDGRYIGTYQLADINKEQLIRSMVGRDVSSYAVRLAPPCVREEELLRVEALCASAFSDISFSLRRGEILGFAGLVGSGRTDVMRAIFGADPVHSGKIYLHGKPVHIKRPEQALQQGIGLLPENRKTQGFVRLMSNADNMGLASLKQFTRWLMVNHAKKRANCLHYMDEIGLTPRDPDYLVSDLSGGNQQKVVLAKWLSTGADILIFDEPTKGIDVGAKAEIYRLMEALVAQGKGIIMVSSELPEVIGMSDRVVVMHEGRIAAVLSKQELSEERILNYAMGE